MCLLKRRRVPPEKALKHALRQQTGTCPACRGDLSEHGYWDLASAIVGSAEAEHVAVLAAAGDWGGAGHYHSPNALADIVVWRAIRCPKGAMALRELLLPIEIWSEDRPLGGRVLRPEERSLLAELVGNDWQPF